MKLGGVQQRLAHTPTHIRREPVSTKLLRLDVGEQVPDPDTA